MENEGYPSFKKMDTKTTEKITNKDGSTLNLIKKIEEIIKNLEKEQSILNDDLINKTLSPAEQFLIKNRLTEIYSEVELNKEKIKNLIQNN